LLPGVGMTLISQTVTFFFFSYYVLRILNLGKANWTIANPF
jgi:hypothetical protein